jgi:hypothetical protein
VKSVLDSVITRTGSVGWGSARAGVFAITGEALFKVARVLFVFIMEVQSAS